MTRDDFIHIPELDIFMEIALPDSLAAMDNPEFRKDLYLLALEAYKSGWTDCAFQIEHAAAELVYVQFPDEE